MDTHAELYSPEELAGLRRKNRIQALALILVGALALAACVTFCALTRTGNAGSMELSATAVFVAAGWIVLYRARFVVRRGKNEISHAELMLSGERSAVTGILEVTRDTVRLPGGVMLRSVRLRDGENTHRVNVNARKARRLTAHDGERVTLYTVSGYAAALDGSGETGAAARYGDGAARFFKNILSQLHVYVIWLILSVFLWGWIFTLVTDTLPAKKVVVFVDACGCEDTALAGALEEELPDGVRMVQVHPFSYALFDDSELLAADIYIVRASDAEGWVDSFAPLDSVGFDTGDGELLYIDGAAYGVRIREAGAAGSGYILYDAEGAAAEDYYLFFNRDSTHTGRTDTAALSVARRLMEMEASKY